MKELKAILEEFGLNSIVLHEQPSGSRTVVEKLEKHSNVGYTFVILPPDDVGCDKVTMSNSKSEADKSSTNALELALAYKILVTQMNELLNARARQNVVLEFGYFTGLLGRDRVCCLHKGDIELPSDMHGIVYIPFKESINEVRDKIVKELKAAGYEIKI